MKTITITVHYTCGHTLVSHPQVFDPSRKDETVRLERPCLKCRAAGAPDPLAYGGRKRGGR